MPGSVSPVVSTFLVLVVHESRRYNICMGREEAYLYKDLDFLDNLWKGPLSGVSKTDTIFSWTLNLLYCSYTVIVPCCYVNIYRFRKNMVVPGQNQEKLQETRRKKNIVTFWYNMTIWMAEVLSIGLIVRF